MEKFKMKKVLIGIIALFAVAAVFLFFFPGLPKYIYIRLADKYPSLNAKLEEFDLSGVTGKRSYCNRRLTH